MGGEVRELKTTRVMICVRAEFNVLFFVVLLALMLGLVRGRVAAADSVTEMRERRHLDLSLHALRVEGILTEVPRTPVRKEVVGLGSVSNQGM